MRQPRSSTSSPRSAALITSLALAASAALVVAGSGCGGGGGDHPGNDAAPADAAPAPDAPAPPADAGVAPPLRNVVALPDEDVAAQATALLGFGKPDLHSCNDCHAPSKPLYEKWQKLGDAATTACLTDLAVATPASARHMIDCLRADPADPRSTFTTSKLGWYAAAAHLDWFKYTFSVAYGASDGATRLAAFSARVGMPKGAHPAFTQAQFDVVGEWFARGMPYLSSYLPDDPPPGDCTGDITPAVGTHVNEMKLAGWSAVNKENHILMFGCSGATDPKDCLASFPLASTKSYGAGWESLPGAHLRVLRDTTYSSSYWTRSSADGRFVAHGGGPDGNFGASITDLQADKVIPTNAFYDPGFFPDNSGFVFQGSGAYLCAQSVLTAGPTHLNLDEPGCSSTGEIGLYQHVGASLGGGDYWIVDSEFVSDDGGKDVTTSDPEAYFPSDATVRLTPMVHTGNTYQPGSKLSFVAPYEGDTVISPSSRLLVSRLAGPNSTQRGYVLRKLVATPAAGGGYTLSTPEIARYCVQGAKPNFSFDERFMVTHHYVTDADAVELGFSGANDPGFQAYREKGASNLYLVDLTTGARTRVTKMQPGQYALYPHFRSDGWIYFIVRTPGEDHEHIVASDAALVLAP